MVSLPTYLVSSTASGMKLTCSCVKCGHTSLVTINEGDDGYEIHRVESGCKHVEEKEVGRAVVVGKE